jgi:uncharacterized OB-fold protein
MTSETRQESGYKKPLPHRTKTNSPYWDALKQHELRLPKCNTCGHIWHPPASSVCPNCLTADNYEFTKLSGKGKIWGWLRMHQRYFAGFADELPYNIIYVELDERPGLRMISNLVEYEEDDLKCDQRVEVVFDDVTEEWTLPKFRPVKG